ncbi:cysteine desulfurase [Synechococcus sp. A18-25c]|uniref:cysteine desulfurase family protein n=1 Tax=Synechococcus sp. A18-25c TaxID=1866938 RepID=UPI001646701F|nr:cysteine desulfurase family protein [Synechococcus sp. A18-25c]QNJ20028.1 cysteine desulfurase [Synechococcus sp. A18-25c]
MAKPETKRFYLDACATAPLRPGVFDRMAEIQAHAWANPSSLHQDGIAAADALERARFQIARGFAASPDELVFTSSATESVHLALHGLAGTQATGRLLISAVEHPAVVGAAQQLIAQGWDVQEWPVDRYGRIRLDLLDELLAPPTRLVSLIWGQSEVGTLQPLLKVAEACRARAIPLHTDATQVVSQGIPRWCDLPVDLLTASSHKCGGPRGIGLLLVRPEWRAAMTPQLLGGDQEGGLRSGTQSAVLAAGMATAMEQIERVDPSAIACSGDGIAQLRDAIRERLAADHRLEICGDPEERLPNHLSLLVRDDQSLPISARHLVRCLDHVGLAVSSGSACSSGKDSDSAVLTAMGVPEALRRSGLRISLGHWIRAEDLEPILDRFQAGLDIALNS